MALIGFLLFFFATAVVMIVAGNRGRSRMAFGGVTLLGGFLMTQFTRANGATETEAAIAAFLSPVLCLIVACVVANRKKLAAVGAESGEHKFCPFCAEPIRLQAIKCRHCSSDLTNAPSTTSPKNL